MKTKDSTQAIKAAAADVVSAQKVYISITGLRLKSPWHGPRFWWHAVRSMQQARSALGSIRAETRTINGVHHTLSVWQSPAAMRAYLTASHHQRAMAVFSQIATGKVHGYLSETVPDWSEVHDIWLTKGRDV